MKIISSAIATLLTAMLATVFSTTAMANSNCDNPVNSFDNLYCLNQVYIQADKDLNDSYNELVSYIDSSGRRALKRGQLDWISERNDDCSRYDYNGFFVNLKCAADTTIERNNFLQDRIRECKSSGCRNSRLGN